ncbi:hypothetical protein [Pyxidicoccus caerfyrddinensis]|uniref:hypothetical protein n=1 Tax=Pyxidicoccus caerfyrddinensis TaxID=2709663 RepID=UPI0013DD5652|nr:hypothetical protein [Pyxidicoccus caerfyrddinensis]
MKPVLRRAVLVSALVTLMAHAACGTEEPRGSEEARDEVGEARAALWIDLASQLGTPVATGNTLGGADEYQPPASCSDSPGGPDVSFKWTAPQAGSFTFTTAGSALDTVLHVYRFSTTALLGCSDDVVAGTNFTSSVTLTLAAGDVLRIVVDSYSPPNSKNGGFKLNIASNTPPPICNTPPGACHVSPGTWNGSTCVYTPKTQGTACDDGNACTTGDVCNGSGTCGGSALACNSPPGQCYQSAGTCSNGSCSYAPKSQGTACNDGNACTTGDVCNGSGGCGGSAVACNSPPSQCHQSAGTCSNGTCSYTLKPTGTACNDGNACTTGDVCSGSGTCGGNAVVCNSPPGQCHQSSGTCSNGTCSYPAKSQGTACNDGNACTTSDVCNGGGTCGGNAVVCNSPPGQCYDNPGTCSNGTCSYAPSGLGESCDDNDACTVATQCSGNGDCVGTVFCQCPAGMGCSNGACYLDGEPVLDCTPP